MQPATRSCGCATIGKRRAVEQGSPNRTTHTSDHTSKRRVVYPYLDPLPLGLGPRRRRHPDFCRELVALAEG